jgi:large subunit ribosomal protein L29
MKAADIRELPEADVAARIAELEEERFRLQFRSATEPLEEPLRLRVLRKDIARLHTILNEKKRKAVAKGAAK